jgi:predicted transcriptional regulator
MFPLLKEIKQRRKQLNLTQKQLADKTNFSQSLITKIESNKLEPSYAITRKIFETLENLEHSKEEQCSELMNKHLISIESKKSVKDATDFMKDNAISQLPVFENKRLVGNISETTIYDKILGGVNKNILFKQKVCEIMENPLPTLPQSTPKSIALPLLKTNSAILLTEKDKIVGILTKEDLL